MTLSVKEWPPRRIRWNDIIAALVRAREPGRKTSEDGIGLQGCAVVLRFQVSFPKCASMQCILKKGRTLL